MSVPPQTVRSSQGVRNGGPLAVNHISLFPFAGEGDQGSGCQVLWEDGERIFCRGSRLAEDGSQSAVLIVVPVAAHPSRSSLDRLAHEHGLKERLDGAWAVRPLEIVRDGNRTMLVLEDIPCFEPLDWLLAAPMEVGNFLRLAISIAVVVGKLHESGLVHKDIKPFNILLNRTTGEVKLTGFGIASRLSREHPAPDPPETIAGTLAYMAPEQTGRMNRSDRFPQRPLCARGHVLSDAHRSSAVQRDRCDGMGSLSYRQKACGSCGAAGKRSGRSLPDRREATGQDCRGALPDRRRPRARSTALSCRMGAPRAYRTLCARRTRRA